MKKDIYDKACELKREIDKRTDVLPHLKMGLETGEEWYFPKLAIQHIDEEYDGFQTYVLPDWMTDKYLDGIREDIKSEIKSLQTEFDKL